jgi:methionine sulfoxide reductase heme-binding subunit
VQRPWKRRVSIALRVATHVGALIPLGVLVWDFYQGRLSVNPIQAAEQRTGLIALTLLLLSLACTPLNILFGFSQAIQRRRALGLYAFFYASLHMLLFFVVDYGLDWGTIWETLVQKRYMIAGMGAFLTLIPLAVTSMRWWMKRMGKNWTRLHRLVYLAGGLALVHFAWVVKGNILQLRGDVRRVVLYGAILVLLLVVRIPSLRRTIVQARRSLDFRWQPRGPAVRDEKRTVAHPPLPPAVVPVEASGPELDRVGITAADPQSRVNDRGGR